ncbi:MAG: hypothetical protein HQK79_04640 [Desulfobacterales bacterium]|nr:hypothetical protein [Desulfobacterales bacterium]
MNQKYYKIIIIIILIFSFLILAIKNSPWANTVYSSKFNDKLFKQIRLGDDKERVRLLLGEPIYLAKGTYKSYWSYSRSKNTPYHMVRKCLIISERSGKVIQIDDEIVWGYIAYLWSY